MVDFCTILYSHGLRRIVDMGIVFETLKQNNERKTI